VTRESAPEGAPLTAATAIACKCTAALATHDRRISVLERTRSTGAPVVVNDRGDVFRPGSGWCRRLS